VTYVIVIVGERWSGPGERRDVRLFHVKQSARTLRKDGGTEGTAGMGWSGARWDEVAAGLRARAREEGELTEKQATTQKDRLERYRAVLETIARTVLVTMPGKPNADGTVGDGWVKASQARVMRDGARAVLGELDGMEF
jgi:hypothetical protein